MKSPIIMTVSGNSLIYSHHEKICFIYNHHNNFWHPSHLKSSWQNLFTVIEMKYCWYSVNLPQDNQWFNLHFDKICHLPHLQSALQNLECSSSTVSIAKFGLFLIYSHHGKIFHLPQSQSSWQNLHVIWWLEYCWYRVNYKTINLPHLQSSWQSLISSSWTVKRPASTSAAFLITKSADRLIYGQLNRSPASYSTSLIMRMSS